ncbi:hypothetical protein ONJ16_27460, partial [Salmonella enterica subsp. enterica serovar Montevideo]|nr:hypothetical protein [Salmonella enterica subsp. enterica serovar Montevideo]
ELFADERFDGIPEKVMDTTPEDIADPDSDFEEQFDEHEEETEGHYLQVEVAARTVASKQPELAEKFLKFMVSPAFQNAIPTGN